MNFNERQGISIDTDFAYFTCYISRSGPTAPNAICGACIVDRSGGRADIGAPLIALATVDVPTYPADALPPELAALPAEEPGSKRLKA